MQHYRLGAYFRVIILTTFFHSSLLCATLLTRELCFNSLICFFNNAFSHCTSLALTVSVVKRTEVSKEAASFFLITLLASSTVAEASKQDFLQDCYIYCKDDTPRTDWSVESIWPILFPHAHHLYHRYLQKQCQNSGDELLNLNTSRLGGALQYDRRHQLAFYLEYGKLSDSTSSKEPISRPFPDQNRARRYGAIFNSTCTITIRTKAAFSCSANLKWPTIDNTGALENYSAVEYRTEKPDKLLKLFYTHS